MNAAAPVEDRLPPMVFTLDLEDHRPDANYPKRFPEITRQILSFLSDRNLQATVFVLGRLARDEPALIKAIADAGHEIAYHSAEHVHLTLDDPAEFESKTRADIELLSDLAQAPVFGFRAPAFSLTRGSLWAVDALKSLGFEYSSSVLPVMNPVNGFPGAPRSPFYWPNGLLEIPAPVARLGPLTIPFLGGFYLRYLPKPLLAYLLRRSDPGQCHWLYCHPHDFDYKERFYRIAGTSMLVSILLWFNRRNTFEKLELLFPRERAFRGPLTFHDQIAAGRYRRAPRFDPS